jgi:hypothetical protein
MGRVSFLKQRSYKRSSAALNTRWNKKYPDSDDNFKPEEQEQEQEFIFDFTKNLNMNFLGVAYESLKNTLPGWRSINDRQLSVLIYSLLRHLGIQYRVFRNELTHFKFEL